MKIKKVKELNEHHLGSKEEQIEFICKNLEVLNDNEIEYIYNHIEAKMGGLDDDDYANFNIEEGNSSFRK